MRNNKQSPNQIPFDINISFVIRPVNVARVFRDALFIAHAPRCVLNGFSVSSWMEYLMKFAALLGVKIVFNW